MRTLQCLLTALQGPSQFLTYSRFLSKFPAAVSMFSPLYWTNFQPLFPLACYFHEIGYSHLCATSPLLRLLQLHFNLLIIYSSAYSEYNLGEGRYLSILCSKCLIQCLAHSRISNTRWQTCKPKTAVEVERHGGKRESLMEVRSWRWQVCQRSMWLNWPSGPPHPEMEIKMKAGIGTEKPGWSN